MSHFGFLQAEWAAVHEAAMRAEAAVHPDPRTACFYARRALELAVAWAYKHDSGLRLPYQDNLSALIHEPTFKAIAGEAVFNKARVIVTLGNRAVHSPRDIPAADATMAVRELFHVGYWLAHTYTRRERPPAGLTFDAAALPRGQAAAVQTTEQLQQLQGELQLRDEKLAALVADRAAIDEELTRLRAQVAEARKAAAALPAEHDYSEAQTRDYFIDLLLKEAGWALDRPEDVEYEVDGMPNAEGVGYVDYVLWGNDGKPLGLVEAKRTRRDPREGQRQAELYADCLEKRFGQRPVIFYSNGYDHWIWDDRRYPPRKVQGFYKKAELELVIQRRTTLRPLGSAEINRSIVERYYQVRGIRRIGEAFEKDHDRKALLVMATGAGKTRTVIALSDLLMRCNWAKRVLFLADRIPLVKQAVNAFKAHLPDSSPVNLVTEKEGDGRVFVSTYPTMMGLIDQSRDGQRRFGVGHFDLIIVDEAHRSIFHKYRAIFDYFDSLLVGLTATPKDEVDRNTYNLFDLEDGVPTDAYSLEEAVKDGFLVPPQAVSVPLRFQREGISYDDLSEEEKDQWDALEWDEEDGIPDRVGAEAINKWLFNADTVDKVLAHVMTRGITVAGGDRLGKTILFAKNQAHADFIADRFNANYPHYQGRFARVITYRTEYSGSLIDDFSVADKEPHLAISVDMLDTGIDIPEVVNLVFFKLVRSKTKFLQMIGRGTRLRPDLFGPGQHKERFFVFDYCQNLEFFGQNPEGIEGNVAEPLGKRLFKTRLALVAALDERTGTGKLAETRAGGWAEPRTEAELRADTAGLLHREVSAMNVENFVVRPRRRFVEKYANAQAWATLTEEAREELAAEVAGLPSELNAEKEEAKRFDLLLLRLQLALIQHDPGFDRLRGQLIELAAGLEEKAAIPLVQAQLGLIREVQEDEWWVDLTVQMLEKVRRRLRGLIYLIDRHRRTPIYTDFVDEMGEEVEVALPGLGGLDGFEKFRAKARAFLRAHQDLIAVNKLRMNRPLTPSDLAGLEQVLLESGVAGADDLVRAKTESQGLGLFVRTLVGLDRSAAKEALAGFLAGKVLGGNQIEFINLIVDHLTEHGVMEAARLYESPFTDLAPHGPEGLFTGSEVDQIVAILHEVRERAMAA